MNDLPEDVVLLIYQYCKEIKNCNKTLNRQLSNKFKLKNNKSIDKQLTYLKDSKYCKSLNISKCTKIDNIGYDSIYLMKTLIKIDISWTNISNDNLHNICNSLTNLTTLDISYCADLTNDGLKNIDKLQKLEILDISSCSFTTNGYKHISKLPKLKLLLSKCNLITVKSIIYINKLLSLTTIIADNSIVDVNILTAKVECLSLKKCTFFNNNYMLSTQYYNLKTLNLSNCDIAMDSFEILSKHTKLNILSIVNCNNLNNNIFSIISNSMLNLQYLIMHNNNQFSGYQYHEHLNKIKNILVDISFFTSNNFCKTCLISRNTNKISFTISCCKKNK